MFYTLLFLILALLVVNLAPTAEPALFVDAPAAALIVGLGAFAAVCALIALQNRMLSRQSSAVRQTLLMTANLQLIGFLCFYHFFLAAHRLYAPEEGFAVILPAASLTLYFLGLACFYASSFEPAAALGGARITRQAYTSMQLRFALPFVIPFFAFELLFDLLSLVPWTPLQEVLAGEGDTTTSVLFSVTILLFFISSMITLLPALIQWVWGCEPLPESPLKKRLDSLCRTAGFRHGGLKIWSVMNHTVTAAIIGVVPRLRYVMFTNGLLQRLPHEQIEAILAHEIGHSQRKHLIIFPFVIFGMIVSSAMVLTAVGAPLFEWVHLHSRLNPSGLWNSSGPILIFFVPTAVTCVLYFRLIFGFFSRNFERQADLHGYALGVPAEHLMGALDGAAIATGGTHKQPNWHHYSIQQRIDYLQSTLAHPSLVDKHHRRVKRILRTYFTLLTAAILFLVLPLISEPAADTIEHSQDRIQNWFNTGLRTRVAEALTFDYRIEGDQRAVKRALKEGLKAAAYVGVPGVAEFYAAVELHETDSQLESLQMMERSWIHFPIDPSTEAAIPELEAFTLEIIRKSRHTRSHFDEIERLIRAMQKAKVQGNKR